MQSTGKRVKRVARLIVDADTECISLVAHGANQQPFAFVKAEEIVHPLEKDLGDEAVVIFDTELTRPNRQQNFGVQKAVFDAQYFDKAAANDYLKSMGFSEFTLSKEDDKYIAKSTKFDSFNKESVKMVKGNRQGVDYYVGSVDASSTGTEASSDTITVEKSEGSKAMALLGFNKAEVLKKFDWWSAMYSSGQTLGEVLDAGMEDGLPPGYDEINSAFWTVVSNSVREGNYESIKLAANEMAELVVDILMVFDKVTEKMEKSVMTDMVNKGLLKKDAEGEATPAVETPAVEAAPAIEDAPAVEAPKADEVEAPATEAPKVDAPATDAPAVEAPVEKSANADLLASISGLLDTFKKEIKQEITTVAGRVEKLEGTSTVRKGTDVTDEELTGSVTKAVATEEKRVFKADPNIARALGIGGGLTI